MDVMAAGARRCAAHVTVAQVLDVEMESVLLPHLVMALGGREGRGESEEGEAQLVRCLLSVLRIASVVP